MSFVISNFLEEISAAAAAAKSLQSCSTLCDPIDGSPPGFPVPGILQARTLERVAISFSNAWKWKVKVKSLSRFRLLSTPWTASHQAPPSSPSHSVVFLYFFALMTEESFLISPCYSLGLCIQMLISFLFSFAFPSLLCTAICKASPDSHFAFLHFFSMGIFLSWSLTPVQFYERQSIVHQALYLSDLGP